MLEQRILNATEAHNEAMTLETPHLVARLIDLLGASIVARIGNVTETRAVHQWLSGERDPQRQHALRFAFQLASVISDAASRNVARAWFQGSNGELGDRSPVMALRDDPLEEIQVPLMRAVRTFLARD